MGWGPATELIQAYGAYREARQRLLRAIGCRPDSMRDPLAEFSEILVAKLTGERQAESPVQKGWDLIAEDGTTTQVRYVANPAGTWVNWHEVSFSPGVNRYALVIFESLEPTGVLIFSSDTLRDVCRRLGKRHPNQDRTLQVTQVNVRRLREERHEFAALGVAVFPVEPLTRAAPVAESAVPTSDDGSMTEEFRDKDENYLGWLVAHPSGYVLNCLRSRARSGLKLHRSACSTIRGTPARGVTWTGTYIKVCSDSVSALQAWSSTQIGLEAPPCGTCRPLGWTDPGVTVIA